MMSHHSNTRLLYKTFVSVYLKESNFKDENNRDIQKRKISKNLSNMKKRGDICVHKMENT